MVTGGLVNCMIGAFFSSLVSLTFVQHFLFLSNYTFCAFTVSVCSGAVLFSLAKSGRSKNGCEEILCCLLVSLLSVCNRVVSFLSSC